jgi:hypothetical protein
MNRPKAFKWHHFFIYFLLGAILGCTLGLSFRHYYQHSILRIYFDPPFKLPDLTLFLLTLAGASGGLAYAMRNRELELPRRTEHMFNPGWLGDCFFGVAGAYVIALIMPGNFPSTDNPSVDLTIQVLATGIIGGYGGRSIMDRVLDDILRRQETLENKVKGNTNRINENVGEIKQVKEQSESGAKAMELLERYLDETLGLANEQVEDLKALIENASISERAIIFLEAKKVREKNAQDGKKKPWMVERTIPIFEALMKNDLENHRIHAQLGYALQGKREPDWSKAEVELSKAIELRDKSIDKNESFWVYEFNRAICRIHLDENFKENKPAMPNTRNAILQDWFTANKPKYSVAKQPDYLAKLDSKTKEKLSKWFMLNNISNEDIAIPL